MPLTTTQKFRIGLYGATLLACLTAAIAFVSTGALTRRTAWVSESSEILYELEALQSRLKDAETGQRGFLLTHDRQYLAPYLRARPGVDLHLGRLDSLLSADTIQRASLHSLQPLVSAQLTELGASIALDTTAGHDAAARLVNSGRGRAIMDSIRAVVGGMLDHERRRLADRVAAQRRTALMSRAALVLLLTIAGVLFVVGRGVIRRDDRQRTLATAEILRLRDEATASAAEMRELAERAAEEAARSEEETARAEDEAARAEEFATQADEARERLESVLAGISDGFLVMDRDLTVLYVNPQGAAMLGRSPEELLQRPLWERVPGGRDVDFDAVFRQALAGGDIVRSERRLAGTERWLATNVYPAGGNLSVFFQDVTERHEARAGLAKATSACVSPSTPAGSGCGSGTSRRPGSCGPTAPTSCTGSRSAASGAAWRTSRAWSTRMTRPRSTTSSRRRSASTTPTRPSSASSIPTGRCTGSPRWVGCCLTQQGRSRAGCWE